MNPDLHHAAALARRFRGWRRSRPFLGGLLLILAGLELLLIPLLSLLLHTSVKVVIYLGIGGVFGVLIGGLLVTCGLLAWLHPGQRVFYAITGVLLAVASFVVTNLGGFFLGMLLGVVGGSLVFGWLPAGPGGTGPGDAAADGNRRAGSHAARRQRLLALPLLAAGLLSPALTGQPPEGTSGGCVIPLLCPSPSPSPGRPGGSPSPGPLPLPAPGSSGASPPGHRRAPAPRKRASAPGLLAAAVPAELTAGSALMRGLSYDGVATVPTASGPRRMLKFSMNSLTLAGGVRLTVSAGSSSFATGNSSVRATGHVVLYATRISGDLLGVRLTFTPRHPPPLVLPVMRFTDVVTDQPLTIADSLGAAGLDITGG
jgi:hypothetical protein